MGEFVEKYGAFLIIMTAIGASLIYSLYKERKKNEKQKQEKNMQKKTAESQKKEQ